VASVLTMILTTGPHGPPGGPLLIWTTLAAGGASLLGYVVHRIRPGKPKTRDFAAELRLKFWSSRFARWLERVARIGLRRTSAPAELTYRPTELALGLAAGALFESLPREQKRELKELPALIGQLERDAELMRKTVDELSGAVASLGADAVTARSHALGDPAAAATHDAVADARDQLRTDLVKQRDRAAQRLAAAVASLESIRLSLLRLKAGTGTVTELTADLSAAREVTERLRLEAAARDEIETMLRGARQSLSAVPPASGSGRA
jgi:serine/threonine-protein kinase